MNRRGFLQVLGAATVATAAGIELIDTAKTFFLPPSRGWWDYEPIALKYQFHVDVQFPDYAMQLNIGEFERRFIEPALISCAQRFDEDMFKLALAESDAPTFVPRLA